jgi:hypothetical protein
MVTFSGQKDLDPSIDLLLARRIAEVTILVGLRGTASAPEALFDS